MTFRFQSLDGPRSPERHRCRGCIAAAESAGSWRAMRASIVVTCEKRPVDSLQLVEPSDPGVELVGRALAAAALVVAGVEREPRVAGQVERERRLLSRSPR